VDIGQRVDPSAIVVAELERRSVSRHVSQVYPPPDFERRPIPEYTQYLIRHIERLPIGTSYPDVVRRLAAVVDSLERLMQDGKMGFHRPHLLVDITGVGRPVFEMLKGALRGRPSRLTGVTFSSGEHLAQGSLRDEIVVGKAYLVSRMQSLLQTGRLQLPQTEAAKQLIEEMQDYEIRVSDAGRLTAGAFKSGTHDDLATALALAVLLPYEAHRTYRLVDPSEL